MQAEQIFAGRYEQIREIGRFILQGASKAGFDERGQYHIELACDEACTNVIEHGYQGENKGKIAVRWQLSQSDFRVIVEDDGVAFDDAAFAVVLPSPESQFAEIVIGGLGIHFMRTLMDEVKYERIAKRNRVTLMKWLPSDRSLVVRNMLDGLPVVRIFGRLDNDITDDLAAILNDLLGENTPKLILDLTETTYCNSAGLRTVVSAWRQAHQKGGDIVLVGLNERVHEIFAMVGFDKIFRIFDRNAQAAAFLRE